MLTDHRPVRFATDGHVPLSTSVSTSHQICHRKNFKKRIQVYLIRLCETICQRIRSASTFYVVKFCTHPRSGCMIFWSFLRTTEPLENLSHCFCAAACTYRHRSRERRHEEGMLCHGGLLPGRIRETWHQSLQCFFHPWMLASIPCFFYRHLCNQMMVWNQKDISTLLVGNHQTRLCLFKVQEWFI